MLLALQRASPSPNMATGVGGATGVLQRSAHLIIILGAAYTHHGSLKTLYLQAWRNRP
jgi:hypothetical protein